MRILVVGRAAFGEILVADRIELDTGRHRHLVSVLADEDMWERPPVRDTAGEIIDPGLPHEVFTCTSPEQAIRYLTGLPFDVIVADGALGESVLAWLEREQARLSAAPAVVSIGGIAASLFPDRREDIRTPGGLRVRRVDALRADRIRAAILP